MDVTADWYWEGNVVEAIARFLAQDGWTIVGKADTRSKDLESIFKRAEAARRFFSKPRATLQKTTVTSAALEKLNPPIRRTRRSSGTRMRCLR